MAKKASDVLLTETELELMTVIWKLEEASVRTLLEELPSDRKMAYTSASTIVRILEKKGFVESRREGKTHFYKPILKKSEYEKATLNHVISNVFDGTPTGLVKRLISDSKISNEELVEIKKIIFEGGVK